MHPHSTHHLSGLERTTDGRFVVEGEDLSINVRKTARRPIGNGAFTDVYKGELRNGSILIVVAIKIFRGIHIDSTRHEAITRRLIRESRVWRRLAHPNIQPYLGYCNDPKIGPSVGLLSHFWNNGTILEYLIKKPDADRFHFVGQIASGLAYLNQQNVIHGDLSGNNVLIDDDGDARLTDFGRAKVIGEEGFCTELIAGSVAYMAPELFEEPAPREEANEKDGYDGGLPLSMMSDIYAFSMLAFQIFTGKSPLERNAIFMIKYVQSGGRPLRAFDYENRISDGVWGLMERCWSSEPLDRPTAPIVWRSLMDIGRSSPRLT